MIKIDENNQNNDYINRFKNKLVKLDSSDKLGIIFLSRHIFTNFFFILSKSIYLG